MKYDSKVHDAIIGSQNKWIGIAYEGEANMGSDDCPLCDMFFAGNYGSSCGQCPINLIGDNCNVYESPYRVYIYGAGSLQMLDYLLHLEQWYVLTAERG